MLNKSCRGAILFLAVGAVAVLSILALGTTSSVLQELKLAKFVTDANTSSYFALSAVEAMKLLLANDETPEVVTLYDLRDREIPMGDQLVFVHPVDEQSKVNVDRASKEVLARLPGLSGSAQLVDEIFAANLATEEELLLLGGVTREAFEEMKQMITVFGPGPVNINTASADVFSCLGIDADVVRKIEDYRVGEDGVVGTEDDKFFSSTAEIVPLFEALGLNPIQVLALQNLIASGQLSASTDCLAFEITVKKAKKKIRFFKIIVSLSQRRILSWHEE